MAHNLIISDALVNAYSTGATCTNDGVNACSICPSSTNECTINIVNQASPSNYYFYLDMSGSSNAATAVVDAVSSVNFDTHFGDAQHPYWIPFQGFRFGLDQYLELNATHTFYLPSAFTIEMWVRVDDEI